MGPSQAPVFDLEGVLPAPNRKSAAPFRLRHADPQLDRHHCHLGQQSAGCHIFCRLGGTLRRQRRVRPLDWAAWEGQVRALTASHAAPGAGNTCPRVKNQLSGIYGGMRRAATFLDSGEPKEVTKAQ